MSFQTESLHDALSVGASVWDRRAVAARVPTPFSAWNWVEAWRSSAPAVVSGGAFVMSDGAAVLPVRLRGRNLSLAVSDVGCPDYLDVIGAPTAPGGDWVEALNRADWARLQFDGCADRGFLVSEFSDALARSGASVRLELTDVCPVIDLPRSFDGYLSRLSRERRQWLRRKERRATDAGITFVDHTAATMQSGFDALVRLHAARWSTGGAFADARLSELVSRALSLSGRAGTLLTTAWLGNRPVGAWLGFRFLDTTYFYQSGRTPEAAQLSVGAVLMARMLRSAIESGGRRFDLLRGAEPYKATWGTRPEPLLRLIAHRGTLSGRLLRTLDTARRGLAAARAAVAKRFPSELGSKGIHE